ncbi:hypothetical protein [Aminobacter niigataensis]|uniref:hypothetical protein n=1 Tax=Aminobacter niigataensis TaxID=83265 RepID=UPI0024C55532|nr:hypothetical protein [Aminobacter niigataensis]CAI2932165.1 conserved exported protein of unknown function [Aminobacter niigataensis]
MKSSALVAAFALALTASSAALAQNDGPQTIAFEGGNFTIAENAEGEKIVAYDGKEIARNYVAFHDRTVEVSGTKVAIFALGDGGNACGPETVLAWKRGAGIQSTVVGDGECGTPPAAVTGDTLYFVPYLLPGTKAPVRKWSLDDGLTVAGELAFTPQPGTTWAELKVENIAYPVDFFDNAELYQAASAMLGDQLEGVALGLSVSSGPERTASGLVFATGCVPHACGVNDSFIGVDTAGKKLYFAKQGDTSEPSTWPALAEWPAEMKDALTKSLVQGE